METYSSSLTAYSDSAYSETHFPCNPYYHQKEETSTKPLPTVRSASHSARKIPAKNKIMKKPIAPFPRTPPKVYKVDPVDFKDVVQKLTGAPELQPTRLREAAPLPLSLSLSGEWFPLAEHSVNTPSSSEEEQQQSVETRNFGELMSPLELSVPPPSLAWSSRILPSP